MPDRRTIRPGKSGYVQTLLWGAPSDLFLINNSDVVVANNPKQIGGTALPYSPLRVPHFPYPNFR